MKADTRSPVFIVGVPRSGTTLLAAMLAAHSRLSCGPETRFFRFLDRVDPKQLLAYWPHNAIEFLFSIVLIEPIPEHYGFTREQLHSYLKERPPGVPAILSSLTEQFMHHEDKDRWLEKSPEHLKYVWQIRRHFPNSPIIRIVRDPRDVALSVARWPHGPGDFLSALFYWQEYDQSSGEFFRTDENSYTLHYEHLVQSPEVELKRLCAFIGEIYESTMLDTSGSAGHVATEKETWKRLVGQPVDQSRVQTWKRELSPVQNRVAEALVGDRLLAYKYESVEEFKTAATVYPSINLMLRYRESLSTFVDENVRFWRVSPDEKVDTMIFVGNPDKDRWLRRKNPGRWWDALAIMLLILKGRLSRRRVHWLRDRGVEAGLGQCSRILALSFHLAGE